MSKFARSCSVSIAVASVVLFCAAAGAQKKSKSVDPETDKKTPSYYGTQPSEESLVLTMYQRIRNEGFTHGHVMQFAGALADGIGPRLTGSPNMAKANAWTRDTLTG